MLSFIDVFTQISEANGVLNVAKLDNYLRDLLMVSYCFVITFKMSL